VTLWDGRRAWLVTRYDDFRAVCVDPRFSGRVRASRLPGRHRGARRGRQGERAFVGMDNPAHDHYRRMFTKEFSTRRMMALKPRIARSRTA
jgi:cytochrome P450